MTDPAVPPADAPNPPEVPAVPPTPAAPIDAAIEAPVDAPVDALVDVPAAVEAATDAAEPAAAADSAEGTADTDAPADAAGPAPATADAPAGMGPAACGARLAELFPALFGSDGPPKPVKLRIHVDLQARAPGVFSRRALGPFFARYTTSNAYLKVLSTATQRFDLDGQPAGEVTEEHRSAAMAELARRREIAMARRAAERAAARPPRPDRPAAAPAATGATGDMGGPGGTGGPRLDRRGPPRRTGRGDERPRHARGEAPARAPHPDRPRGDRPADGAGASPGSPGGPGNTARGPRPQRPPAGPDRGPRGPRHTAQGAPHAAARPPRDADAATPEPQDPAQRERALLLRQFESSPLTKANFCVLKRIAEAELDAQLDQARRERAERHKR